jgi:pimeloyl-ACP methyl ester carboxylesterase
MTTGKGHERIGLVRPVAAVMAVLLGGLCLGGCAGEENAKGSAMSGEPAEYVILIHGLGRTKLAMWPLARRLKRNGYATWNESYASTRKDIVALAEEHIDKGLAFCRENDARRIHFVTHSLGGIMVRAYLQDHAIPELGKIVMLAPPNKGSEVADKLKDWPVYEWVTGPAGQALGTGEESLPKALDPIPGTIGIIAGTRAIGLGKYAEVEGAHDGTVSTESAKLNEMDDFLLVKTSHSFIANSRTVQDQTVHFLRHGAFRREDE